MAVPLIGVLLDEDSLFGVPFFSFEPPRYTQNPQYNDIYPRGRTAPHSFYVHTEARVWSWEIHLAVGIGIGGELPVPGLVAAVSDYGNPAAVRAAEQFIRSMVVADYGIALGDIGVVSPPHIARIVLLTMVDCRGTIRNLNVTYPPPYHLSGLPMKVDMSFELHEQLSPNAAPEGVSDVRFDIPNPF